MKAPKLFLLLRAVTTGPCGTWKGRVMDPAVRRSDSLVHQPGHPYPLFSTRSGCEQEPVKNITVTSSRQDYAQYVWSRPDTVNCVLDLRLALALSWQNWKRVAKLVNQTIDYSW
ncbi:hypothetical protein PoB_000936300, partial [Plakobranchus ocellatus]